MTTIELSTIAEIRPADDNEIMHVECRLCAMNCLCGYVDDNADVVYENWENWNGDECQACIAIDFCFGVCPTCSRN